MDIDEQFLEFAEPQQRKKYHQQIIKQEEYSFKAWQADSIMPENNVNLLRNLKSQLVTYEQKYHKQNPITVKLPSLQKLKRKISQKSSNYNHQSSQIKPLTQRRNRQSKKKTISLHKSIEINRSSSKVIKSQKQHPTYMHKIIKNHLLMSKQQHNNNGIGIAKVHEMRFQQNTNKRRIRKRDIYLSIFGQRGKNKVQKIMFDDENKPYQIYLERKNVKKMQKQEEKIKQNYNVLRYKLRTQQQHKNDELIKSTGVMRF